MPLRHVVAASTLALAGCPDRTIAIVDPDPTGAVVKDIPVSTDIDLLFVIDNSNSTQDKQDAFIASFKQFTDALERFPTGLPNIHMGVISTTIDGTSALCPPTGKDDGRLHVKPAGACTAPTGNFISDIADPATGARIKNYPNGPTALADTFGCIANLGTGGCGFESPLEAMKRALDGKHPENAGFLRKNAFLAVIVLADEDDCSAADTRLLSEPNAPPEDLRCAVEGYRCDQPFSTTNPGTYTNCTVRRDSLLQDPAKYRDFLASVKGPSQIAIAVIGGAPNATIKVGNLTIGTTMLSHAVQPACTTTISGHEAIGRPGNRLADFVDKFGDRGLFGNVCAADYGTVLTDIGNLLFKSVSPCLEGDLDTTDADPNNPGLQPDCTVSDFQEAGTEQETEQQIPRCTMSAPDTLAPGGTRPCWWVANSPASCATTETHLELRIERSSTAPAGTVTRVQCATKHH